MKVGDAVRAWREAFGLSQERLAEATGHARNTIARLERGQTKRPSNEFLQEIVRAVRTGSIETLLQGPNAVSRPPVNPATATAHPPQPKGGDTIHIERLTLMVPTFSGFRRSGFSTAAPEYEGMTPLPRAQLRGTNIVLVRLTDDSMYPDYPEGCYVAFDLGATKPYTGEHVIVGTRNGTIFRTWTRLGGHSWLVPINRGFGRGQAFNPKHHRILGVWLARVDFNNARRLRRRQR